MASLPSSRVLSPALLLPPTLTLPSAQLLLLLLPAPRARHRSRSSQWLTMTAPSSGVRVQKVEEKVRPSMAANQDVAPESKKYLSTQF